MRKRQAERNVNGSTAKQKVKSAGVPNEAALLRLHQHHLGLYGRIAARLNVDASYVSRVASGQRKSESIMNALLAELSNLHKQTSKPIPA
jgi:hypothetical protein